MPTTESFICSLVIVRQAAVVSNVTENKFRMLIPCRKVSSRLRFNLYNGIIERSYAGSVAVDGNSTSHLLRL
jgi:hypothetical protein